MFYLKIIKRVNHTVHKNKYVYKKTHIKIYNNNNNKKKKKKKKINKKKK